MAAPAAGGSVLARFEAILAAVAPEFAGHVQAVKFDADTVRLDVAPDAPAYGTKVRWIAPKLITPANEQVPNAGVRTLHVLPPTPGKTAPTTAAAGPAAPPSRVDPAIAQATERQTAALQELARRAFPEARRLPGQCASPDRAGPRPVAPSDRGHRGRCAGPGPRGEGRPPGPAAAPGTDGVTEGRERAIRAVRTPGSRGRRAEERGGPSGPNSSAKEQSLAKFTRWWREVTHASGAPPCDVDHATRTRHLFE